MIDFMDIDRDDAQPLGDPRPHGGLSGSRRLWWLGVVTSLTAAMAWTTAVVFPGAPPRSGPNCRGASEPCLTYPYVDAAAFVPGDFLWMIPAFFLGPLTLALVIVLSSNTPPRHRPLARIGTSLATVSAATLMIDYYVQFTTVQSSLVRGELDSGLSVLSQYNPHGVFIALEDLGYVTMLAALAVTALVMSPTGRSARILRRLFGVAGTVGVVAFPVALAVLGRDLEYLYEVLAITIAWTTLLVGGVLAAVTLRS